MQAKSLLELAVTREVLFPPIETEFRNCHIGDNFAALPDPVLQWFRGSTYSTRVVKHTAIELVRLPAGARVFGAGFFLVECDGVLVAEQVPPRNVLPDQDSIATMAAEALDRVAIADPCVMVARFGLMTWGHWVGELLPRIALTERAFPGRFRYVLPPQVFNSTQPRNVWNSIWDTIRMLGIGPGRIVATRHDKHYVFANLHGMTSIISDAAMHPGALNEMRAAYMPDPAPRADRKIAILRTESTSRNIINIGEIIVALRRRDYEFIEVGKLPFQEQLYLFATAANIVGVLASGLTGLFFAADRPRVLSVAPQGYVNKFFYSAMQLRNARYYDVRGLVPTPTPGGNIFADYQIDVAQFEHGLNCLEQAV